MDAVKLFSETFVTVSKRFGTIRSFRSVAKAGLPAATNLVHKQWANFAEEIFNGTGYDRYFLDKAGALEIMGDSENVRVKLATRELNHFEASIDSTSLVFAHSIVDAAAFDYCRVTVAASLESWETYVLAKKVSLADLKETNYANLLAAEVDVLVKGLERQSLLIKIDRLFEICQPPKDFDPMKGFRFDRKRLVELDQLRHEIVHSGSGVKPLPSGEADLWFLEQTAAFLCTLIHLRFGLLIDPKKAVDAL